MLLVGEPEKLDSPEGAQSFERENIVQRVEEAEQSLEAGLSEAAFALAWSACEAAIRELIAAQGFQVRESLPRVKSSIRRFLTGSSQGTNIGT